MTKREAPAWQVNPKSKMVSPEVRAAYKARTLVLITLALKGDRKGYALATSAAQADRAAARIRKNPPLGATGVVTVAPYPYDQEVAA